MDEVYPGRSVSCCLMQYRGLPPVHEKDLVFCYGLRFYDEEVIRASEFSKSTRPRSQTRHTAQTVSPIPGNDRFMH